AHAAAAPDHPLHRALRRRRVEDPRRQPHHQTVLQRGRVRRAARRPRRDGRSRRGDAPLPGRRRHRAARGDRPALRPRPRAHRLRQRLGRADRPAHPLLRRRGDGAGDERARLHHVRP
ncbi:MAG: Biosynthetic Aromatic amino acid aminotransferase beta @ Histidinol-phosphate aminotransferase, partial [uncultured Acetobacteraceae bacterium]